jgi:hypothetical protein
MWNIITYVIAYAIGVIAIILGGSTPSKWLVAFGIATILATTWVAFWKGKGQTYFDFATRTLWAKFTYLEEQATLPVIGIYIVAFVIAALVQ